MPRILIVGFGNPLRSDDGLGWHVAQQLSRQLASSDIQVIATPQLTPEMAEFASNAEQILFIDASRNGTPGAVRCEPVAPERALSSHSHDLSPAAVLKLARDLYGRCPPGYLLTIAGESFDTGESMSPSVMEAIPALLGQVSRILGRDLKA